jgi:hypothetical protein
MQKRWNTLLKRRAATLEEGPPSVRESTLVRWVQKYPVMNECTHFGCLMDPKTGGIRWIERGAGNAGTLGEGMEEEEHIDPELVQTEVVESEG